MSTGLQVRFAAAHDMPEVYALRYDVFVVGQDVPAELERDEHDLAAEHAVAVLEGRLVGTGRLIGPEQTGRTDRVATVGRMAVAAQARGTGAGSAVLRALERRARERGLQVVELHAQVHARGFYERLGYAPRGEPYDEAGIEHVTMRKHV